MKAIVNTSLLGKELRKMSEVISKITVLPILSNVKLEFEKGKVTIYATDLETTLVSKINCECQKPFTIVVDHASILDICNKLNEPVTIEEKDNQILVYGDDSKYKIPKEAKESEFPNIPDENFLFSIDVESDFFTALYSADSCKNPNDTMTTTNTACLDFRKDALTIVGTDAFALYKKDFKIKTGQQTQSLARGKFVQAVKHFESGKLSIGEKFAKVESGDMIVITRLQEGKYCNYNVVLPETIEYNLTINRTDLIAAINKTSITASKITRLCVLNFESTGIKITSKDIDFGKEGESNIRASHKVEIDAIGVNGNQLLHILNLLDSEEVDISVTSPSKSLYLKPSGDDSVLCLLQPLMIN